MSSEKLTLKEKVMIVANSDDVIKAIRLLAALFKTENLKSYITYDYVIDDEKFCFTFLKLDNNSEEKTIDIKFSELVKEHISLQATNESLKHQLEKLAERIYEQSKEITSLKEALAVHENDLKEAAGELMLPLPIPNSDMSKMFRANRIMRRQRDENWSLVCDLKNDIIRLLSLEDSWSTENVLMKLIYAANYLLNEKNYDGIYHEEILHCVERANQILSTVKEAHLRTLQEQSE